MNTRTQHRIWNISLWAAQIILAAMFLMSGFMKITTPIAELAAQVSLAREAPGLIRFIGISEILGALGLLLPSLLRIRPVLTPIAAIGIATIMIMAIGFHISKAEFGALPIVILLGALAVFVVWGRLLKAPVPARG